MISAVSSAGAALRSTQNTCAPSRAKVTAVALPLPQPGPIEPAPTTIAVLPLSRSIDFSPLLFSFLHSPDAAPGYSLQALMVVTLTPTGCPKISDNVRQFPSWHSRHSPAAPELASTTCGIGSPAGPHLYQPLISRAPGGGSMPAPEPLIRACVIRSPFGKT